MSKCDTQGHLSNIKVPEVSSTQKKRLKTHCDILDNVIPNRKRK